MFLKLQNVIERTGLPRSTIYALIKEGRFPSQVKLGQRSVAWVEREIEEWEESVIAASRQANSAHGGVQ